jgi:hypothetical protein
VFPGDALNTSGKQGENSRKQMVRQSIVSIGQKASEIFWPR